MRILAAILLSAAALSVLACGDDSNGTSSTPAPEGRTTATTPPPESDETTDKKTAEPKTQDRKAAERKRLKRQLKRAREQRKREHSTREQLGGSGQKRPSNKDIGKTGLLKFPASQRAVYAKAAVVCRISSPKELARRYSGGSKDHKDIAAGYAKKEASSSAREAANDGCLDGLAANPN